MSDMRDELRWEQQMVDNGIDKYHAALDAARFTRTAKGYMAVNDESATSYGISLMKEVTLPLEDYINQFIAEAFATRGKRDIAAAYLARCTVREVAFIAAKTIIDSISADVNQTELIFRIAGKLEDQMRMTRFHEDYKYYFESLCSDMRERGVGNYRHKRKVLTHCHQKAIDNDKAAGKEVREWIPWPKTDRVHIGLRLIDLFIHATGLVERQSVRAGGRTMYKIQITTLGEHFIKENKEVCQYLQPDYLPTIIPPDDWTTPWSGGFWSDELRRRRPLVNMKGHTRKEHSRLLRHADLDQVFDAVNLAQRTPWRINEFVLEQFEAEMRVTGIGCPADTNEPAPASPHPLPERGELSEVQYQVMCDQIRANLTHDEQEELGVWKAANREWHHRRKSNMGRLLALYHCLTVAKKLALKERFYYVHKLDWRGRIYAVGTYVNPQGADAAKAVLEFADSTRLGRWGYWHLALHAAGVYGVDKVSLEDRLKWVHDHGQAIMDTWSDPAQTRDFWGAADKPYLFLAACKELAEIWMMHGEQTLTIVNRKDCEWIASEYESRIPCSQDGSCNGLQHFSAMLRDPIGSMAVNLCEASELSLPNDIYGETAAVAARTMQKHLESGTVLDGSDTKAATIEELQTMRNWLDVIGIDRKLCKRSTMIIPYGGQKGSCRADVTEVLSDKLDKRAKLGEPVPWDAREAKVAAYLAHHYVWGALDVTVQAARKAMKFLSRIATINNRSGRGFSWTTPVGFVVYQDYKNMDQVEVSTQIAGRMRVKYVEPSDETDVHKQRNGFPPNFVHSLDAAHLIKTVNAAADVGIEHFGLVHDSYAVPAGHCEAFHKCIREQFVDMYATDRLFKLVQEQRAQHPSLADEYPSMADVEPGAFDLEEVLNSPYFFR